MHRFFIDEHRTGSGEAEREGGEAGRPLSTLSHVRLPEKIAHQVREVLHMVVGEQLVLLDNSGNEFVCVVTRSERKCVEVEVIERRAGKPQGPVKIRLCQGLLKSARFEWILEKGTELGVATFVPTLCRRSMTGLEEAGSAKQQRWRRILQEAAEQCGRARIPELLPIRSLMHALNDIPQGAIALMPWEKEQNVKLRDVLQQVKASAVPEQGITVVLFIGPEGGLMTEEVQLARGRGIQIVSLGPRILRAETAALAAVANVMYALD
jgi:16S rRNA (uracil1498-N3)-methyltransferase